MKYFEMFAGVAGFSIGIDRACGQDRRLENILRQDATTSRRQEAIHGAGVDNKLSVGEGGNRAEHGSQATCVGFSETDKYASAVLKYRFPNTTNYGDCQKINWSEVPDFGLLVGGSPCQNFSIAGKRAGLAGKWSGLFVEFVRALEEKQPKHFIWENVKGVMSSRGGWDFANIQAALAEAGYSLWWQVLNAKDFGVPQNRERVFIVGTRGERGREVFFEPSGARKDIEQRNDPTHSNNRLYGAEGISPTLNTAQGGNRQPFIDLSTGGAKTTENARALQARYAKGYSKRKGEVSGVMIPEATNVKPVLTPNRIEKRQNGRRMKEDGEPMFTLKCQDKHGLYDGVRIRRLTPTECCRLMSWPDDWNAKGIMDGKEIEISDSQRYRQSGNGVVSDVVDHVVKELINE